MLARTRLGYDVGRRCPVPLRSIQRAGIAGLVLVMAAGAGAAQPIVSLVADIDQQHRVGVRAVTTSAAAGVRLFVAMQPDDELRVVAAEGTELGVVAHLAVEEMVPFGGGVVIFGGDDATGIEPWFSNGSVTGTHLLADIAPGDGSSIQYGTGLERLATASGVYFGADDGEHGRELWVTDGTSAGTRLVADLSPGSADSYPTWLTEVGDDLLFSAYVEETWRIWRLDVARGAVDLAYDLGEGNWVAAMTAVGGRVLAVVVPRNAITGWRLVAVDGHGLTAELASGNSLTMPKFYRVGELVYFEWCTTDLGLEVWVSDGTPAGTHVVADIEPGSGTSWPIGLTPANDRIYFTARTTQTGTQVWSSQGTAADTVRLTDLVGYYPGEAAVGDLVAAGSDLFFWAWRADTGWELWQSDGTTAGTGLVLDVGPGTSSGRANPTNQVVTADGRFFFHANDPSEGLWVSDGTAEGTHKVVDGGCPSTFSSCIDVFGALGPSAYLEISDRFYRSSGGPDDPVELTVEPTYTVSSEPRLLTWVDGSLYFVADDGVVGEELWTTDGTTDGTRLVADVVAGEESSEISWLVEYGGRVAFDAGTPGVGHELWISDGTAAGTSLVADLRPGEEGSWPRAAVVWNGLLYFLANAADGTIDLWRSDGSEAGTAIVAEILNAHGHIHDASMVACDRGVVLAFGSGEDWGSGLWFSDGTSAGTMSLVSMWVRGLTSLGDVVLFAGRSDELGGELWRTDGTPHGTVPVLDLWPLDGSSDPAELTAIGHQVYYTATDGYRGRELWVTDGTAAGTRLVADATWGQYGTFPHHLAATATGVAFWDLLDRLWLSDGSAEGTVLTAPSLEGYGAMASHRGHLFAMAGEPAVGLWMVPPGSTSPELVLPTASTLRNLFELLSTPAGLFFAANDRVLGTELWRITFDEEAPRRPGGRVGGEP